MNADELARRRTEWALERTQLAWVRTTFALVVAGLALDKGVTALSQAGALRSHGWVEGGHIGGVVMSAVAAFLLGWATWCYLHRARELAPAGTVTPTPTLALSLLVILLGLTVTILLLLWG